jgi:hypothetical protein
MTDFSGLFGFSGFFSLFGCKREKPNQPNKPDKPIYITLIDKSQSLPPEVMFPATPWP